MLKSTLLGSAALILTTSTAVAGPVLIINGASTTTEVNTTNGITTQLTMLHEGVGNTVTVADTIPMDISGFDQVWDIRFFDSAALTPDDISLYVSYLQGGGGIFAMGENAFFAGRNSSVLQLIEDAGGGTINFLDTPDAQIVLPPFDMPNAVTNITFNAAGGIDSSGTGQFITETAGGGSGVGVAFGLGDLALAPSGGLTTIFDVNFLQDTAPQAQQDLAANLIGFLGTVANPPAPPPPGPPPPVPPVPPVPTPVPEPETLAILGFGLASLGLARRRKKITL